MKKVTIPPGVSGEWRVERKYIERNPFQFGSRVVPSGEYTAIFRGSTLVMSDTPDEMRDHHHAVDMAHGKCLVAGLGIGMVLQAICEMGCVSDVTCVEISSDVLSLVQPHYDAMFPGKIKFINASIFDFKPKEKFDWAWFDIWDTICADNLDEMRRLHRKFARSAKWKGSWARELCESQEREWKRNNRLW